MSELADETKDVLRQYRAAATLNDTDKAALLARVLASIDAGEAGPALDDDVAQVVVLDRWRTAGRVAVALAGAAAVLLLIRVINAGFVAGGEARTDRPEQAVYGLAEGKDGGQVSTVTSKASTPAPASATGGAPREAPVLPASAASKDPEPASAPPRVRSPAPPKTDAKATNRTPDTPIADSLADEMRMMSRVRAALAGDRPGEALAALDAHARRYPAGQMAEDRQALRARSLCAAGRSAAAATAARAFLASHPESPHRAAVTAALRSATERKCVAL